MGRDFSIEFSAVVEVVSIHAPAWGATDNVAVFGEGLAVSIHAPAWGATALVGMLIDGVVVSIHAPAWGATSDRSPGRTVPGFQSSRPHGARPLASRSYIFWTWFQSTRPHGARPAIRTASVTSVQFQSTRPHGARPSHCTSRGPAACFNPRARMGRDPNFSMAAEWLFAVSIHAPAWGATHTWFPSLRWMPVSIHAPAWGATYDNTANS